MKLRIAISTYVDRWWVPITVYAILLALFLIVSLTLFPRLQLLSDALFVCACLALLGMLAAAIRLFLQKQWPKGFAHLGAFLLGVVAAFLALGFLMSRALLGPDKDGFADHLTIPRDIGITEPLAAFDPEPGKEDAFQQSLLAALASPGSDDPTVTATVTNLAELQRRSPAVLRRYLATSPSWRLYRERDNFYATRRWMVGTNWLYTLHGYYTNHDIGPWSGYGIPDFQTRLSLGLSGSPWDGVSGKATKMMQDEALPLILSSGKGMHESWCLIRAGGMIVEIFEQSGAKERRLTKAALAHLEKEFAPLAARPAWKTTGSALPGGSIGHGAASFLLRKSLQPGIYDSVIRLNPGEPGMIYLKAYEVTGGTPLSAKRLKARSNEWIGWSDDPGQLFFSNAHFTIYEGDWGKPYAARFEVWFAPDSGKADRKLLDKVFIIEGWQR